MIRTRRQGKVFRSNFVAIFVPSQKGKVKAHESKAETAGAYPSFISMKQAWEYCDSPRMRC